MLNGMIIYIIFFFIKHQEASVLCQNTEYACDVRSLKRLEDKQLRSVHMVFTSLLLSNEQKNEANVNSNDVIPVG